MAYNVPGSFEPSLTEGDNSSLSALDLEEDQGSLLPRRINPPSFSSPSHVQILASISTLVIILGCNNWEWLREPPSNPNSMLLNGMGASGDTIIIIPHLENQSAREP